MSAPPARSALRELRPTPRRLLGAAAAAAAVLALGWFVGVDGARSAGLAAAAGVLVLVVRFAVPAEASWPEPPGRRSRPGWHVVAATQRLLASARTDREDRAAVAARLDRLAAGARGDDPRLDAVRRAVGLRGTGATRTARRADHRPPHDSRSPR